VSDLLMSFDQLRLLSIYISRVSTAIQQKAGGIMAVGITKEVTFGPVDGRST